MEKFKIDSKEDYDNKLDEIASLFGFKIEYDESNYYIIINNKRMKMKLENGYYYIHDGKQKICFKGFFAPHYFSTSALIELFISNGKDKISCSLEQELRPGCSGTEEMPIFKYIEYVDGKTYSFCSNMHQVETIESDTLATPMFDKMIEYCDLTNVPFRQNNSKITGFLSEIIGSGLLKAPSTSTALEAIGTGTLVKTPLNKMAKYFNQINIPSRQGNRLTRFLLGIDYFALYNDIAPTIALEIINNLEKSSFHFFKDGTTLIYGEYEKKYKQDKERHYDFLPFLKSVQDKCLNQVIRPYSFGEEMDEEMKNYMSSIIRNPEAIRSFNETISYLKDSVAWPYISEHYASQIEFIKKIQNGECDYEFENTNPLINNDHQVKLLQK